MVKRAFVKAIWGNLALADDTEALSSVATMGDYKLKAQNDSFIGAIERWSCRGESGMTTESLHVRLLDGSMYHIAENEVSKTVERIHGLLCGKTIHISGNIDHVAKTISLAGIKAFGATKGKIVRRLFEKDSLEKNAELDLKANLY